MSLAVAGAAALLVILVRLLVSNDDTVKPFKRTINDVELVWRCEVGHEFHAAGQVGPRACWTCGRPAYPITQYECPVHGAFDVSVQFKKNEKGQVRPSALRLPGKDWVPVERGLVCPRCHRRLTRVPDDQRPVQPREPGRRSDRRARP